MDGVSEQHQGYHSVEELDEQGEDEEEGEEEGRRGKQRAPGHDLTRTCTNGKRKTRARLVLVGLLRTHSCSDFTILPHSHPGRIAIEVTMKLPPRRIQLQLEQYSIVGVVVSVILSPTPVLTQEENEENKPPLSPPPRTRKTKNTSLSRGTECAIAGYEEKEAFR
jgi:hypothetical protein